MRHPHRRRDLFLAAAVLACLAGFIGCELSEPPVPDQSNGGMGLSLIYPPTTGEGGAKAPADGDTVRAWLFQLGADEASAFRQRPAVDDSFSVPAAFTQGRGDRPLTLEVTIPLEEQWWRLFIESEDLSGYATLRLRPSETDWRVFVALSPDSVAADQFTIYEGFAAASLSAPAGSGSSGTTTIYPIAVSNTQPVDGLELRFAVAADSATVLIDHGSRFFGGGDPEVLDQGLQRLVVGDPDVAAYRLRLDAREGGEQETLLEEGHDVLFYVVAHGDSSTTGICVDPDSAFVRFAGDESPTPVAVLNPGDCEFPPPVNLIIASPAADDFYDIGDTVPIRWSTVGVAVEEVRIDLIQANEVCATIAETAANDGAFDWIAERCGLAPGGYRIRLTDLASGESGLSAGTFTIGGECSMEVTSPGDGELVTEGHEYLIAWDSAGNCGDNVRIELFGEGGICPVLIAEAAPNTGIFSWIAEPCGDGYENYTIVVVDNESGVADTSDGEFAFRPRILVKADGSGDFPTIQAAIDTAIDGTLIELDDGEYFGQGNYEIDFLGKAVTVSSLNGEPSSCIIDCKSWGRGFVFRTGEASTSQLIGVTIAYGYSYFSGGAINCKGASPTITNCVFLGCYAQLGGAVSCSQGASPGFELCEFNDNIATDGGGGLFCDGESSINLNQCSFDGNTTYSDGGAIYCGASSAVNLFDCELSANEANNDGGAVYITDASFNVDVGYFEDNRTAEGEGGAIYIRYSTSDIRQATFYDNSASRYGGAFYCDNALLYFDGTHFSTNSATFAGGALYCWESLVEADDSEFYGNFTTGDGGVIMSNNAGHTFTSCQFEGNTARNGSVGYYVSGYARGDSRIYTNCTIVNNAYYQSELPAVIYSSYTTVDFIRTIIAFNQDILAVYCDNSGDVTIECCDIFGNGGPGSCIAEQMGINGNVALDPQFCSPPPNQDYRLNGSSPCAPEFSGGCGLIGALGVGCE